MVYLDIFVFLFGFVIQAIIWNRITRQVNGQLSEAEQFSTLWMRGLPKSNISGSNMSRIWRAHREHFPDSYLRLCYVATLILWLSWWLFGGLGLTKL